MQIDKFRRRRLLLRICLIQRLFYLFFFKLKMDELTRLLDGNKRYLTEQSAKDFAKTRAETLNGQQPFAIVITCSDSRVVPEYIFDANLGELFVIRTAGNVVDKIALGSIEYAVEHLHVLFIIVLGHEKCGAVKTAWEMESVKAGRVRCMPSVNIASILKKVGNAIKKAKGKTTEDAVNENIKIQIREIIRKSAICKELFKEGKLKIVGAKYKLTNGKVEIIE